MSADIRLFHTKAAIIIGVLLNRGAIDDRRRGYRVENPVVVIVGGESVSLMPMYTLTVEREYVIPDDTLLYAVPMTPSEGLREAYEKKYAPAPVEVSAGFGLTTYPSEKPADLSN